MAGHRLGVLLWMCVCVLDGVAGSCPAGRYGYRCSYQCHCPQPSCNPTSGCQPATCSRGWSGPTCQKENIALNKNTSASSVYMASSNAVDGDVRGNLSGGSCFHSTYHDYRITSAWWRVDLGQKTLVYEIVIYLRTDYIVRRNGIQIYIADTAASPTDGVNCYNVTGNIDGTGIPDVLKVTCSSEGRYLVLYTTTKNTYDPIPILDFCEVEANACGPGTFGTNCNNTCHCDEKTCNLVTGVCPSGVCLPGWQTETCDTECDAGSYGPNCAETCSRRNCKGDNSSCDHVTGECLEGCKAGWDGTDCTRKCDSGSYGPNCAETCSRRNCKGENSSCDQVTGECLEGCKAGWDGTDCTRECDSGSYGPNCAETCSRRNCKGENSSCDQVTGECLEGCKAGWDGTDCTRECDSGSYGPNCAETCSRRNCKGENSSCDQVTGECLEGCKAGWDGTDCTRECDSGSYGPNCAETCSRRNCKGENSSCDQVTGECLEGCKAGWDGTDCTRECDSGSYGPNCAETCSRRNCKGENSSCDQVTGECLEGCKAGWDGTDCTRECDSGSYGPNCAETCSRRNCKGENSSCDQVTGECLEGCKAGWDGTDCTRACDLGTFGTNCSNSCHCDGETCDHVTGVCPSGMCLPGWQTETCDTECDSGSYGPNCAETCSRRNCKGENSSCDQVTGECLEGCKAGWDGTDCIRAENVETAVFIGTIVGSVVAIAVLVLVVVVVVFLRKRRSQPTQSGDYTDMLEIDKVEMALREGADNSVQVVDDEAGDTYYNIDINPAVTVVVVDQLGELINELQGSVGGFQAEFQKLPTTFTQPYNVAKLEENKAKNKYISYYPYDATRVVLQELPDQAGSDYINASYIDGYSQAKAYIAAQAPTAKTLTDFWRMIWEQNCTRVVMVTHLAELGRVKCEAYWSDTSDMHVGDFIISVTDSSIRAHWAVRELKVTDRKENTTRCISHFHFTTWPDHGTPEEMALTEFLWLVRTSYNTQDDPLLVHCSAGVGRTGTYIALDYLLDQALAEDAVDVFGCVSGMRDQRKGMIQTKEQYTCVYMALHETLQFGNTVMSVEEFKSSRDIEETFSSGRMAIPEFIETLNRQRKAQSQGTSMRGRVWINGRSDILAVSLRSYLSVNGYLLTEAPSVTTASLFWKLTEEQESSTVIVLPDSHQSLSSFVPSPGDSLDLGPVTVRCSTENPVDTDVTLLNIYRQMENAPTTPVRVYILNILPAESPSTLLELLEQIDHHTGDVSPNTITVIYSDGGKQNAAMLCILSNIVQGLKYDKRVEIYNNLRAMAHCLDQDITQADVALCYDLVSAYLEFQNIYANT